MTVNRNVGSYLLGVFIVVISTFAFLDFLPRLMRPAGNIGFLIATLYAFVPVFVIGFFVWLIDRWEPEPKRMYVLAFMWGAGVSIFMALVLNSSMQNLLWIVQEDFNVNLSVDRILSSYIAPLTEEGVKGLGILLIYFAFYRYFNGPIDGIIYGTLIGSGFAFTENILYFVNNFSHIEQMFQVRFLDGPLNHEAWTAVFGFFIGFACYSKGKTKILRWIIPAYLGAIVGHWFNNDALHWQGMNYHKYVFLNNVPVMIILGAFILFATKQEHNTVINGLQDYVNTGWISPDDLLMLHTLRTRTKAQNWAENKAIQYGISADQGRQAMKDLQANLLELGYRRTIAVKTDTVTSVENRVQERIILDNILRQKRYLVGNGR